MKVFNLSRKELKNAKANDFNEGDVIKCNKYLVHISFGSFKNANMLTTVDTQESMVSIPVNKQPAYIRDFINRR